LIPCTAWDGKFSVSTLIDFGLKEIDLRIVEVVFPIGSSKLAELYGTDFAYLMIHKQVATLAPGRDIPSGQLRSGTALAAHHPPSGSVCRNTSHDWVNMKPVPSDSAVLFPQDRRVVTSTTTVNKPARAYINFLCMFCLL
jgi:hypothetical protein